MFKCLPFIWSRWNKVFFYWERKRTTGYKLWKIKKNKNKTNLKILLFSIPGFFFTIYEMSKEQGFLSRDRKRITGSFQWKQKVLFFNHLPLVLVCVSGRVKQLKNIFKNILICNQMSIIHKSFWSWSVIIYVI